MLLRNQIFLLFVLLFVNAANEQTERVCEPMGVKISLGDSRDKTINLGLKKKNLSSPDYTITYFSRQNCPLNYVSVLKSDRTELKLQPIISHFTQEAKLTHTSKGSETGQQFEMYLYEYQFSVNPEDFILDSFISYSCPFSSDNGSSFSDNGSYQFFNPDYSKLASRETKVVWVADIAVKESKVDKEDKKSSGLDNMLRIEQYIRKNRKQYVSIIGGGDYAYDLVDENGERGVNFLKSGEFLFSQIPFVTVPGNHESWDNYSYYQAFFRNPNHNKTKSDYYTVDFGNLLMIGLNTNRLVYDDKHNHIGLEKIYFDKMLKWLDKTLKWANRNYKWVVVYSHQNIHSVEDNYNSQIFKPLEDVLAKHKVDIYLAGHVHAYERIHPNYKGKLRFQESSQCKGKQCSVYESPKAPVYVIDGTGGTDHFSKAIFPQTDQSEFIVTEDRHMGFSTISVKNDTHLLFQHIRSDTYQVFDSFYIYKPSIEQNSIQQMQSSEPDVSYESTFVQNDGVSVAFYFIFIAFCFILVCVIIYLFYRKHVRGESGGGVSRQNSYNPNNPYNQQYADYNQKSDDSLD